MLLVLIEKEKKKKKKGVVGHSIDLNWSFISYDNLTFVRIVTLAPKQLKMEDPIL